MHSEDGVLFDAEGRELLLRGVNARVEGLFDVTFDDGRISLETIPAFVEADCAFLATELGMNHLRLPINWSGVEPEKGQYNVAYVDQAIALAEACSRHGVYTIVDFHQDAYSKHIGEDGAPLWAIVPPPTELLEGPLDDLEARRTSTQVLLASESFFNNAEGLQDAYAEMAAWVATRIEGKPGILGLELMNEPVLPVNEKRLDDFHAKVGQAVREAAPTLSIVFEPNSLRNFSDSAPVRTPVPFGDAVYGPHIYVDVFEDGWASEDVAAIRASVEAARREADDHAAALYVGEFGNSPDARGLQYVRECLRLFDEVGASSAWWVYEEYSQGSWGLYEPAAEEGSRGTLREAVADVLARAYPVAIAGRVESFVYDEATRTLTVNLREARGDLDHILAAPERFFGEGVEVTCDGSPVEAEVVAGRVAVRCAGAQLVMKAP